jgi:hypothetical protein
MQATSFLSHKGQTLPCFCVPIVPLHHVVKQAPSVRFDTRALNGSTTNAELSSNQGGRAGTISGVASFDEIWMQTLTNVERRNQAFKPIQI